MVVHAYSRHMCCFLRNVQSGRWKDSSFLEKYQLIKKRSIHDCLASKRLMRLSLHQAACHAYPSNQTQQALQQQLPRVWLCGELLQAHQAELLQIKGIPYVNSSFQHHCLSLPNLAIPYGDFVLLILWEQLQCAHTHTSNPLLLHHGSDGKHERVGSRCKVRFGVGGGFVLMDYKLTYFL